MRMRMETRSRIAVRNINEKRSVFIAACPYCGADVTVDVTQEPLSPAVPFARYVYADCGTCNRRFEMSIDWAKSKIDWAKSKQAVEQSEENPQASLQANPQTEKKQRISFVLDLPKGTNFKIEPVPATGGIRLEVLLLEPVFLLLS